MNQIDPLWAIKRGEAPKPQTEYEDIYLPKNTALGLYIGALSLVFGFAMTWHIIWLSIISLIGIITCVIIRLSGNDEHDLITASEVKEMEMNYTRLRGIESL